jgi:hypothetical protein
MDSNGVCLAFYFNGWYGLLRFCLNWFQIGMIAAMLQPLHVLLFAPTPNA